MYELKRVFFTKIIQPEEPDVQKDGLVVEVEEDNTLHIHTFLVEDLERVADPQCSCLGCRKE